MSTYAVLGATGNTGLSLLTVLSQAPTNKIHAFCRSHSKLLTLSPEAALENPDNIKIFEGTITDHDVLKSCLASTDAIFLAVAVTDNVPGCTIAIDTARAVVHALEALRAESPLPMKTPRLIVLSSSSISPQLSKNIPAFAHWFLLRAASYIYADLRVAETFLRSERNDWISCTFVKPGGLSHDVQRGHVLSFETQETPLGWLDLAAGMVEIAESEGDRFDGRDVSVLPKGKVRFPMYAPLLLVKGLLLHFFPGLYPWLKS